MLSSSTAFDPTFSAPDFRLLGVDGQYHALEDFKTAYQGVVIAFICNHCPYVIAIRESLIQTARDLQSMSIGFIAINSNDAQNYPDDSYENMQRDALRFEYSFPYLWDETQSVARAYGAICTPDFFGFNAQSTLVYRGRLDAQKCANPKPQERELLIAMQRYQQTQTLSTEQWPSMGCSIKWKVAT